MRRCVQGQRTTTADLHCFLVVCALAPDLYCPGYNPRLAADIPSDKKGDPFRAAPLNSLNATLVRCLRACFLCRRFPFVMDRTANLRENVWRHVLHVVHCLSVFVSFLENFVFRVAAYFEITSGGYIAAFQDFCHGESPCKVG